MRENSWWQALAETAKQLKYIIGPAARRSLDDYVSMLCRLYCNSFTVNEPDVVQPIAVGLWPSASLFNHSCESNCYFEHQANGTLSIRARRPIGEGEEVTICYLNPRQSTEARRIQLFKNFFFVCNCTACAKTRMPAMWHSLAAATELADYDEIEHILGCNPQLSWQEGD